MNVYFIARSNLSWICTLCYLMMPSSLLVSATKEEDNFIANFGNDFSTSGRWEKMRLDFKNTKVVNDFLTTMHALAFYFPDPDVKIIRLGRGTLIFSRDVNYKPMMIDFIEYTIGEHKPRTYFVTKGVDENSVQYLIKLNSQKLKFKLGRYVNHARKEFLNRVLSEDENEKKVNLPRRQTARPSRRSSRFHLSSDDELFDSDTEFSSPMKRLPKTPRAKKPKRILQSRKFGLAY